MKIDPTYAAAWNNLGIGYEQLGRFDERARPTRRRWSSIRTTSSSADNYDLFREIYDRQNRRRDR